MKRTAALLFLATLSCLQAQDIVRQVFQLKYAEPSRLRNFMLGSERLNFDDQLKTIAVEATKTRMLEFEEIVKRFDVPPPPIPRICHAPGRRGGVREFSPASSAGRAQQNRSESNRGVIGISCTILR